MFRNIKYSISLIILKLFKLQYPINKNEFKISLVNKNGNLI